MIFNFVLQLIFSIFRNNSYTSPFNSSTEGTLLKCMLQTAHNACNSKDVDVPWNLTCRLLLIIMDHLLIPVITLHLSIVEKKTFYCNDHKITEFGTTDKNSFTAYIVLYKWIDTWFLDSNRRVGVWSLPRRWHILSIPLTTGRGTSAETCGLDDVFPPDDLGSRPEALC